jgi:hypothetical protein
MRTLLKTTASKVVASIVVWFVVFLILVLGGFMFSPSEDWGWTTLGGLLLPVATVVSVFLWSRGACRSTGQQSGESHSRPDA